MQWQIGDIKVTSIVEQPLGGFEMLMPTATSEIVKNVPWLKPNFVDDEGIMQGLVQGFVVEAGSLKIMIDTCIGNDKQLSMTEWHQKQFPFLERLEEAGYSPDDIDIVLCTHLHLDHIGWNTYLDGETWKPTFPNARYLFAKVEYDNFLAALESEPLSMENVKDKTEQLAVLMDITNRETYVDSIRPVVEAGLVDFVETNHQVCEGVHLTPTHGHTEGHVSVLIESNGQRAMVTGDMLHHPLQIARPEIWTIVDEDRQRAVKTRERILQESEENGQLVIGSHFCEPTAGYIRKHDGEYKFDIESQGASE